MAKGFFITGTDTGVGKTVITGAMIKTAGLLGLRACGMKPVETGCKRRKVKSRKPEVGNKNDLLMPSDGIFLKNIAGMDDSLDSISPVRYENPLAPLPASRLEGIPVDLKKIKKTYSGLAKKYDCVIIEGIGGLLVPIKKKYFVLDLARDFGLPLIVVSRPGLGTINHTMLTVKYAIREGLEVAGIIINHSRPPENTIAGSTNPEIINRISPVPVIGIFPYLKYLESGAIEKAAVKNLDIRILKKYL